LSALALTRDLQIAGVVLEARGDRLHVDAPVGLITPEIHASLIRHKPELLALLQRPAEPTPAEQRLIAAIDAYSGWWPLSVSTLCRALAAQTKPLAATPTREFLDHLDAITPEHEAVVRRIAAGAVDAGLIPERSVRLR
jgi:hypothetical protein